MTETDALFLCTLTYKVIHKCQSVYLHDLLKPVTRTLLSSDDDQLVVPRVSSKMGDSAFSLFHPKSSVSQHAGSTN